MQIRFSRARSAASGALLCLLLAVLLAPRADAAKNTIKDIVFESIFLQLNGKSASVKVNRKGSGGALTSFGDTVLLLTHEGRIYAARAADDIKLTKIEPPENGFSAYRRASRSKRFKQLNHVLGWFRYNDILYYKSKDRHGLAISYTEFHDDKKCYGTTVAILPFDKWIKSVEQISASKDDWQIIFRTTPCLPLKSQMRALEGHLAGGRMAFRSPSTIHLGSGDYHWDGVYGPEALSQNPDVSYGKVIDIDIATREARIATIGNRNMQGVVVDLKGQLWVTEHGMRGGDELNRIVKGKNYGWPKETLGTRENKLPMPNTLSYGRHETFEPPTYAWLPSVGISGLTVINGFHPSWNGDLLACSLSGESLWRIRVRDNRVMFAERILLDIRIRYVHQHTDGRIVIWTDDKELIFFQAGEQDFTFQFVEALIKKSGWSKSLQRKITAALDQCVGCHSLAPDDHSKAPSLASIFGAPIAATDFGSYSAALKSRQGRWTKANLAAFLNDPAAFAPGTSMPDPEIKSRSAIAALIDLMRAIKEKPE